MKYEASGRIHLFQGLITKDNVVKFNLMYVDFLKVVTNRIRNKSFSKLQKTYKFRGRKQTKLRNALRDEPSMQN